MAEERIEARIAKGIESFGKGLVKKKKPSKVRLTSKEKEVFRKIQERQLRQKLEQQRPRDFQKPARDVLSRFVERKEQRSEFVRVNPALDIRRQADQMQFGTFLRPDYEKIAAEMRARRSNRLI